MKFITTFIITFFSLAVCAQVDTIQPPYKRFPTLPPIQLLLGDSATKYTKDAIPKSKPVLVMLFSPDCVHCQQTAEEMMLHKEELKNIHIVMSTMHSLADMNSYVKKYRLAELKNVVAGKDMYYLLPPFYSVRYLPFMAFYNKSGELISVIEGGLSIPKVIELFKANP
ncbi:MAG: hypothetical protein JWP69_828 [Flaviaesturariibacter sp.]|nr:hypothetical protein [Flaviaesturariibacter sp.]